MLDGNVDIDDFRSIFAGKFRRYHGESWFNRLTDIKTLLLNVRDFLYLLIGTAQSLLIVRRIDPDVIFLKGGFVGVPIGLSGAFWGKKMVTHDSDAASGLANRLISRWVMYHATAMSAQYYKYPGEAVKHVGVLVGSDYKYVSSKLSHAYRQELDIPTDAKVLMITGGSHGAAAINQEIARFAMTYLKKDDKLHMIHIAGKGKTGVYEDISHPRLQIHELVSDMFKYSGAADVIVTRAGANTLAEFGVQAKSCVVVPNPLLTGGHQLINAEYLAANEAAIIVDENTFGEEQGSVLWSEIDTLLYKDQKLAKKLADNFHTITIKDAAKQIAKLLINISNGDVD